MPRTAKQDHVMRDVVVANDWLKRHHRVGFEGVGQLREGAGSCLLLFFFFLGDLWRVSARAFHAKEPSSIPGCCRVFSDDGLTSVIVT